MGDSKVIAKHDASRAQAQRDRQTRHILATVPDNEIFSEAARRRRAMQTEPPTPEKLRPCPHCAEPFGTRRLRKHAPICRRTKQATKGERLPKTLSPELAADQVLKNCRQAHPGMRFANPDLRTELVRLARAAAVAGEDLAAWIGSLVKECAEYHAATPPPKYLWVPKGSNLY